MKQHYQVLDGLRGTAALTVVVLQYGVQDYKVYIRNLNQVDST